MSDATDVEPVTVPEVMRRPVMEYVELLRELGGKRLQAVTVFGTLMSGSFDAARHVVQSVAVLDDFDLEFIRSLAGHGERLGKSRFRAPLIMTPAYIESSLDTFPLELLDISQCHVTVFGTDYFAALSPDGRDVRRQCERELKVILMGLRQGLLATTAREEYLGLLEADAVENLVRTLRGLLFLRGEHRARTPLEVLAKVAPLTGAALDGVQAALDPEGPHGWEQFRLLYRDVEALGNVVDDW